LTWDMDEGKEGYDEDAVQTVEKPIRQQRATMPCHGADHLLMERRSYPALQKKM